MARKRKGTGGRPRASAKSPQAPAASNQDPATKSQPIASHPDEPFRRQKSWLARTSDLIDAGVVVAAWVLCMTLGVFDLASAQPALQTVAGFCLLASGVVLVFAHYSVRLLGLDVAAAMSARVVALALAILALAAAVGRDPTLHSSPFSLGHLSFGGFPSELPFIGIAVGAAAIVHHRQARAARLILVGSVCWATAVLLWPAYHIDESYIPLLHALKGLTSPDVPTLIAGIAHLFLALQVAAAWGLCLRLGTPTASEGRSLWTTLVETPHIVVSGAHLLGAFASSGGDDGSGGGSFAIGALVFVCGTLSTRLAHEVASHPESYSTKTAFDEPGNRFSAALGRTTDWVVPAAILTLYALLKSHGMGPSNTDENIYFYMAAELGEGRIPYVDYFFAHPPMHVLVPGAVMSVTGYELTIAKLFAPIAGAVSGLVVWAIGRRHFGRLTAAVAMVCFLFAAETLKATTNMTGINLTTMWLMLGLWQCLAGNALRAGLFMAMAALTGLYSAAAICAILLLSCFRSEPAGRPLHRRFWVRQLGAFLLLFGGVDLLFRTLAGASYVEGVYTYHGLKAQQDNAMRDLDGLGALIHNIGVMVDGRPFTKEIYYHANLWIGLFTAPLLGFWAYFSRAAGKLHPGRFFDPRRFFHDGPGGIAAVIWLTALALFIQYAMFRELYSFYFVLIYPALALLVGYTIEYSVRLGAGALTRLPDDERPPPPSRAGIVGAALVLTAFSSWLPWSASALPVFGEDARFVGRWRGAARGSVRVVEHGGTTAVTFDRRFAISADYDPKAISVVLQRSPATPQGSVISDVLGRLATTSGEHRFRWPPPGPRPKAGDMLSLKTQGPRPILAQSRLQTGPRGTTNDYHWQPAPTLTFASPIVKTLFWSDQRVKGGMEPGYRYYLWTKKRFFESLPRVAAYVAEHTRPGETIAGGSTLAPLVALAAGRRLAAGEVDTNGKRFKSGLLTPQDYWTRICADNVRLLVAIGQRSYFTTHALARLKTVQRWFRVARTFQDSQLSYGRPFPITIYERVGAEPCRWEDDAPALK